MSAYRADTGGTAAAGPGVSVEPASRIVATSVAGLATRMGLGSGVLGWLAMSALLDLARVGDDFHEAPPVLTLEERLVRSLPGFISTALLGGAVVRRALRHAHGAPRATLLYAMLAGALNGVLCLLAANLADEGLAGIGSALGSALFGGIFACVVSVPLGLVFGAAFAPFVAAAGRALSPPTHAAPARLDSMASGFLFVASAAAVLVGRAVGLEVVELASVGGGLGALATWNGARAVLRSRRHAAWSARLRAGLDPALVLVPLADALPDVEAAHVDDERGPVDGAVVARSDVEAPLRGKPLALALMSGCYRDRPMPAAEAER